MIMVQHNCRVCGLYIEDAPWGIDGQCPTYEYCPCCDVEFGYQDYTLESTKKFRQEWLDNGAKWAMPKIKPENWDLIEQMKNIPEEFR
ncbi:MAG: hypothetical protein WC756_19135 [Taibaiella sp.]|jgi:hypothetical protein